MFPLPRLLYNNSYTIAYIRIPCIASSIKMKSNPTLVSYKSIAANMGFIYLAHIVYSIDLHLGSPTICVLPYVFYQMCSTSTVSP